MPALFLAVALAGLVALTALLFSAMEKRKEKVRIRRFLHRFTELGTLHNLTFSSQEMLTDGAIALDGRHRKLLVLMGRNAALGHRLVHLDGVARCSVTNLYRAANPSIDRVDACVEKIVLRFDMKGAPEAIEVEFYNRATGAVHQVRERHRKAGQWEAILSKMLKGQVRDMTN